jgi:beta-aspartyl-peptidase (threonine type)
MKPILKKLLISNTFLLLGFATIAQKSGYSAVSISLAGDAKNIDAPTKSGTALIGGGGAVNSAYKWMISRSGGGDVVVITASNNPDYSKDIYQLGGMNSVETLNIVSREQADNDTVANTIRNAEMLFIAGGDQSRYMRFWRGTKTQAAINYLLNVKKVPVGGTSAGCAILSGLYYSGEGGSVVSDTALLDPFNKDITLYNNDLLHAPYLQNVLTDQHYLARKREGRHVTFMARMINDWGIFPMGIAPNERTAVCIDENGNAKVYGESKAYFISTDASKPPEKITGKQPLEWVADKKALKVYEIQASDSGAGNFSVKDFNANDATGGKWYWWYATNGKLYKEAVADNTPKYAMVIHGGAGTILKKNMTPAKEKAYTAALTQALQAGYAKLQAGSSSLDAVEAAIHVLEDNPLFNAGKGAVFTHDGKNEMDAAIMDGKTLGAGSVAGVSTIRNPISAARAVMEKSEHVMMAGRGAEQFAQQAGLTIVDPKYFYTEERWKGLKEAIKEDSIKSKLDHSHNKPQQKLGTINHDYKFGTVGAVALDNNGNLAAGTSTGGMTNKRYGRIGDAPIIGAGTYANNQTVAISCTGWGEFYIRNVVAHDLSALMEYAGLSVEEAGNAVIKKVGDLGGDGGLIALDKYGNMAMPFNTEGMYRGTITKEGKIEIHIYKE